MAPSVAMQSPTLYTDITEVHYAAIINEAVDQALWATNVCKQHCRFEDISAMNSKGLQLNYWDANTAAAAVTETADMASTTLTMSSVTLNTAEVGAMTTLTDWLLENSFGAYREVEAYGAQLGRSISKKIDTDITALFSALNSGTAAGTGSGDTDVHDSIATALYYLNKNNTAQLADSTVAVLHPQQVSDLRKVIMTRSAVAFDEWDTRGKLLYEQRTGYQGTFLGVDIFQSTNVAEVNNACRGAVFIPNETFAYVQKRAVRPFTQRDESQRATEVGATLAYAVGEIRDLAGVPVSTEEPA